VRLTIDPDAGLLVGALLEPDRVRLLATTLAGEPPRRLAGEPGRGPDAAIDAMRARRRRAARRPGDAVGAGQGGGRRGAGADGPRRARWRSRPTSAGATCPWASGSRASGRSRSAVDNDTKAAALAEKLFGAARDAHDFVVIAGHSGIGGALYLGRRLQRGAGGFAGEIGHVTVVRGGRPCGCGDRGCLEAYLSEQALRDPAASGAWRSPGTRAAAAAAAAGDAATLELFDELGDLLGGVLADLVDLVDPERVVLAGALTHVVPYLLPAVERALARPALAAVRGRCDVVASPFGPEAVPMGGVALAMEAVLSLPAWWADEEIGTGASGGPVRGWW
jgi:hypothetical protein